MKYLKKIILKVTPKFIYNKYKNRYINIYKKKYNKTKITNPKRISVIIPNYNYKKYLKERIDSILLQTYPIYEIIILDDCSTDDSVSLIKEIISKNKDFNIKLIENKENSGSVFNQWKKGFENATGDYVWIAEADDSCHPKFLETVIKPFDDNDVVISYCESMRIDGNNLILNKECRDWVSIASNTKWNNSYINSGEKEIKETLSILNTILNVSAVVFKNDDSKKIINILEKAKQFKMSGDWFTYYSILKDGKIAYTSKSLNYFRRHGRSTCTAVSRERELKEVLMIQKDIRENYELNSEQLYRQQIRYAFMIDQISKDIQKKYKNMMVVKVKWIFNESPNECKNLDKIMEIANFLVKERYVCDLYFNEDVNVVNQQLSKINKNIYDNRLFEIYSINDTQKEYDISIMNNSNNDKKDNNIYFYSNSELSNKKGSNVFVLQNNSLSQNITMLKNIIDRQINK